MIPLRFDPPAWQPEHLHIRKDENGYSVTWPITEVTLASRKRERPDHTDLLRRNPQLKFHGLFGYSIGKYHEFFVTSLDDDYVEFRLASAGITFGDVTPLAVFLFAAYRSSRKHGYAWDHLSTIRITNAPADAVEAYLINAMQLFAGRFYPLRILACKPVRPWEPDEIKPLPKRVTSIPTDIEPLRLFYHGLHESESESACLQFYRVLEFYAFFEIQSAVGQLRVDNSIDERQFLLRVSRLVFRNDRGPIVRLVARIAGKRVLSRAVNAGLIPRADPQLLGDALYDFRNSLVHAKYDQRALILTPSPLAERSTIHEWQNVLRELSRAALGKLSRRAK